MILDKNVKDLLYKGEHYNKAIYMGKVVWEKEQEDDGWIDVFHDETLDVQHEKIYIESLGNNAVAFATGVSYKGNFDNPIFKGKYLYLKFNNQVLQEHNKKLSLTENLLNFEDMTNSNKVGNDTPFGIKMTMQPDGAEYGHYTLNDGMLVNSADNKPAQFAEFSEDGNMVKIDIKNQQGIFDIFLCVPEPVTLEILEDYENIEANIQKVREKHQAYMDDLIKRLDIRVKVES